MKSDLDALMQAKNLDAFLVLGNAEHNPPMYYLTGGGHLSGAAIIQKRGEQAVLFHQDMERDEAAKSGLETRSYSRYPYDELLKEAQGDVTLAMALRFQRMFADMGMTGGRLGVYGQADLSASLAALGHLRRLMPALELIGESREDSLFMCAMETKDEAEVARIRRMGAITTRVVGRVAEYLTSCEVRDDEVLLQEDGAPLTVAQVKSQINLWLAELGAENPQGTICAIGRDAGVPHSSGNPEDLVRLGRTIVFDIFPCEAGGGYFYDFTRTWCLGYAPDGAQELYDQVRQVYQKVLDHLGLHAPFKEYQRMACEFFEARGHPSLLNTPAPVEGYVHSLGHGLGLNVHERPWSALTSADDNVLRPGAVITVEPGLYYPERGMGVRIEDSLWLRSDGGVEILAEYPYDFVLPMKKWEK